jgi:hypothetical protein
MDHQIVEGDGGHVVLELHPVHAAVICIEQPNLGAEV